MGIPTKLSDKVGARWSPSFPRQSLARRRARNIVQVHAHALNGSWECYHVVRIGLGAIWGDHGRRRSLHFTTPHLCLKNGWVYPLCPFPFFFKDWSPSTLGKEDSETVQMASYGWRWLESWPYSGHLVFFIP